MGDINIEETNYKAFIITLASFLMLMASIAIIIYGITEHKMRYWLPGILALLVCLIWFFISLFKATSVKILMTITRDGIIDNSSVGAIGFISFDDIKEFQIVQLFNAKVIGVIPKDTEEFLRKLSPVKRRMVKRNIYMQYPPISINVSMAKDMALEDIFTLLVKRLHDYSSLYD